MKQKTEVFTDKAAFLAAQRSARKPRKTAQAARPELPRAKDAARTGLSTYIKAGWSWAYFVGKGYQLTHPDGRATGWCVSELEACQEAKELCQ